MKRYFYLFLVAITAVGATSCKHRSDTPSIDLVKDSVYMYAKEDYLWYDALPSTEVFNPRGFSASDDLTALQMEVDALSQYKINPLTHIAYEYNPAYPGESKYSFVDQGQTSTLLGGSNSDFGFYPVYASSADLRVRYVNPGSPAAKAGIHRGDQITAIAGVSSLDNSSTNIAAINAALSAKSITMTLKRANTTTYNVTVTAGSYTNNPVMKDTVYTTSNNKKVGYLVFSTFTSPDNAKAPLDAAFNYFISQNITDLIVDLRYNGGGYVETAEYLDNLIVPATKSGTTMYTAYYNNKLQADDHPLLSRVFNISPGDFSPTNSDNHKLFSKQKTLNITGNVIFIISGRTASASELAINNLIPHMTVKLVGKTSYGKPVGFFGIPIDIYQLYIAEFETKNSAGGGGYYTGMQPGTTDYPGYETADDYTHDFGDPAENMLSHALSYINVGTYSIPGQQVQSLNGSQLSAEQQARLNAGFKDHSFNGMLFKNNKLIRRR